jgi:hypothetical protein
VGLFVNGKFLEVAKENAIRSLMTPDMFINNPFRQKPSISPAELDAAQSAAAQPYYFIGGVIVVVALATFLAMLFGSLFGKKICLQCGNRWRVMPRSPGDTSENQ